MFYYLLKIKDVLNLTGMWNVVKFPFRWFARFVMNTITNLIEAWESGRRGCWSRTGNKDHFGRDLWVYDPNAVRPTGFIKNLLHAISQNGNALCNGNCDLTMSAQAGSWQVAKIKGRGTWWPKFICLFYWVFFLSWRLRKVDWNHCVKAWEDKT